MYNVIILSLIWGLIGCTQSQPSMNVSESRYPNEKNKVQYEAFAENGEFLEAKTLTDPLAGQYGKQLFKLRSRYNVETLGQGPVDKRVNIVFIGDGYQANELGKYETQVNAFIDKFLAAEVMAEYKNMFLFHRVDVVSSQSGISIEGQRNINSPLGMISSCNGLTRLLCINIELAMQAANNAPKVDMVFAIANTDKYGGAGYRSPGIATFSGGDYRAYEVAFHEFGHAFAGLADEYDYAGADVQECLKSGNASIYDRSQMQAMQLKWYQWLGEPGVGAYPGVCYTRANFRPTFDSKMRHLGRPFYAVNNEQIIFNIYRHADFMKSHTPEGTYGASGWLYFKAMEGIQLKYQWFINSKYKPDFDGISLLDLGRLTLKSGVNQVKLVVSDNTHRVRDELGRQMYLTKELNWTLIR